MCPQVTKEVHYHTTLFRRGWDLFQMVSLITREPGGSRSAILLLRRTSSTFRRSNYTLRFRLNHVPTRYHGTVVQRTHLVAILAVLANEFAGKFLAAMNATRALGYVVSRLAFICSRGPPRCIHAFRPPLQILGIVLFQRRRLRVASLPVCAASFGRNKKPFATTPLCTKTSRAPTTKYKIPR